MERPESSRIWHSVMKWQEGHGLFPARRFFLAGPPFDLNPAINAWSTYNRQSQTARASRRLPGSNSPARMTSSIPETSCNRADPMRRFNPDQRQEFERIALVHREVLLRVACCILRSESLAEDAVQETLLSAWRAFHTFERGSKWRA
jgi:hypothetical protein